MITVYESYDSLDQFKLGFDFNGFFIINPYYDETMRFEVNPIEYYGITEEQTKLFKK